jgi:hypothetical protein
MNNRDNIRNQIKMLETKNMDLKSQMQVIIRQMQSFSEFSYGDTDNVTRLSRILNEHCEQYLKNETAINMIRWTIKELENNGN